jgi:hypothetical protein
MSKISLDPKAFFGIVAVVVVVVLFFMIKAANTNQKVPLPDPNMFKTKSAQSPHA